MSRILASGSPPQTQIAAHVRPDPVGDASLGVLKDDVGERVAARDLLLDLRVEIVLGVFGFPIATREAVAVAQSTVRTNERAAGLSRKLGDEGPVLEPGRLLEQGLEGRTNIHLIEHTLVPQGCDAFVIPANGAMRGCYEIVTGHNSGGNTSTLAGGGPSANGFCPTVELVGGCEIPRT